MRMFALLDRKLKLARLFCFGLLALVFGGLPGALAAESARRTAADQGLLNVAEAPPSGASSAAASTHSGERSESIMLFAAARVSKNDQSTGATSLSSTNRQPSYLRDVQPIFMRRCSRCHNQQARFVYNWLDYRTAFIDRWEIRRRVWDSWQGWYYKESMPIANSPESLAITEDERVTIRSWVEDGGIRGERPPPGAPKTKEEKIDLGRRLFTSICAACHQATGRGVPDLFPPLAGSDFLNADKRRAIKIVINGRQGEVVVNGLKFNNSMPSFPLTDEDIANVLTFVYNSFGNAGFDVSPEEVKRLRSEPPDYVPPSTAPVRTPPNPYE